MLVRMAGGRTGHAGRVAGVVLASGAGSRVGSATNKVYLPLGGRHVLSWSLEAFARTPGVGVLVLVTRARDADLVDEVLRDGPPRDGDGTRVPVEVVHGGDSRQASELCALRHLTGRIASGAVDTVLLHDGARPLVTVDTITAVLRAARDDGGAVPGIFADDLVAVSPDGGTVLGRPTGDLVRMQTPQGFAAAPLLDAYERAEREGFVGTDTASCVERFGTASVRLVPGDPRNIKITYRHDLVVAERVLAARTDPSGPEHPVPDHPGVDPVGGSRAG